ncbi:MAG: SNF2 helicase associated domain-containing protein [Candidatus Aenigmarchaeota archaeon]|nr:SNF2 helicase associated domain-containing protein [Candidatus Aenigmarchaeota archaeon]
MKKTIFTITEKNIKNIADSAEIVKRGWNYYREGRVLWVKNAGSTIASRVRSHYGIYTVEIYFDEDEINGECNCPYPGNGCKHIVAVLYHLMNNNKMRKNSLFPISLAYIESRIKKDELLKSINIVLNGKVDIKKISDYEIYASVHDKGHYLVSVQMPRYFMLIPNNRIIHDCTCNRVSSENFCEHVSAALLDVWKQKKGLPKLEEYARKIRMAVQKEKFASFKSSLDNITVSDVAQKQQYGIIFSASMEKNSFLLKLEKAAIKKYGLSSNASYISQEMVQKLYPDFSAAKKRSVEMFLLSMKMDNRWSIEHRFVKSEFSTPVDFELLSSVKNLYQEDPTSFRGCFFPQEKAFAEFSIENCKDNNKLLFSVYARYNKTVHKLFSHSIFYGKKHAWAVAYNKGKKVYDIFEIDTSHPELLVEIIKHTGIEISKRHVKDFVKKYYTKLSNVGSVILTADYKVEEISEKPVPRLFLRDYMDNFCIDIRFLYGKHEVAFDSHDDIVFSEGKKIIKIKRDYDTEKYFYSLLLDNYVSERNNVLVPAIDPYEWLANTSTCLISRGYEIYGTEKLINQRISKEKPKLFLEVSSGIDWFDIKGSVEFGKEKLPLIKVLDALGSNEKFVKLSDGRLGVIPKKWLEKLSGVSNFLVQEKNNVKASMTQISIIEALADIADKTVFDSHAESYRQKISGFTEMKDAQLPEIMQEKLRDYQKTGYSWLKFLNEFSFGGCLADEMGLGKTVQVLTLLMDQKEKHISIPSLVVVPTSLVFNWIDEIKKFTPSLSVYVHHRHKRLNTIGNILKKKPDIVITTYGTLRNDIDMLSKKPFHYVVLDESQHIKNPVSRNARSVRRLRAAHRLALTGTPVENNLLDLWSQFSFLNPGLLGNMDQFRQTFMKPGNEEAINALRNTIKPFIIARKKEAVAKELPEKQITNLYCQMTHEQYEIYNQWKARFSDEIKRSIKEKGFMKSKIKILEGLLRLRQICNHPALVNESYSGNSGKFQLLTEQIKEAANSGHKVLVYSSFVRMLDLFRKYFDTQGIRYSYLDGSTIDRKKEVQEFQHNDDIKVFLLSLKAGGVGLNITAADYVFIVDPWWNPAAEMQAIDRTHRIGQTKSVFVYKAIVKHSVEEKILELQKLKQELVKNVITAENGIVKRLTREDLNNIFS